MKVALLMIAAASLTFAADEDCQSMGGERIGPGAFQPAQGKGKGPNPYGTLPEFCRIAKTLTPVPDSQIGIEVWLPMAANWNGKLQSVGNGAWAGSFSYPAMATALAAGYAAASTDTGHKGGNPATFIPGHPEKVIDFAYRAVHEMTVAAKALVNEYYSRGATKSYFNGCSTGGRQALAEAQRYPNDYDGIIAGAPAINASRLQGTQVWTTTLVTKNPEARIPQDKFSLIKDAALAVCDANDGVKDGVIENPMACKFDPATLRNTLTPAQIEAVRKTYEGPKDTRGRSMFPGLEPGSEAGWNTLSGARPMALADETYKYLVFGNADWDYLTFDPARDMPIADRVLALTVNTNDANLRPFFDRGGKLILYHGWADPGIAPRNTVNYVTRVMEAVGPPARANMRLFMVPGMGHCGGGDGTSTFNMIEALDAWADGGTAPATVPASRVRQGQTDRTRPLCAYPATAQYDGSGSTDDASNFTCK